jgi:hypothetical protein
MNRARIFISHKETDRESASALVQYLLAALHLERDEILCTSVPGFNYLPFGHTLHECLRDSVQNSTGFLALITEDSFKSSWVRFELGAAWALSKMVLPILGPGIPYSDARLGPLATMRSIVMDSPSAKTNLLDGITQLGQVLNVAPRVGAEANAELDKFLQTFRRYGGIEAAFDSATCKIVSAKSSAKVPSAIAVKVALANVPDDGYLYIFIERRNGSGFLMWPKDSIPTQTGDQSSTVMEGPGVANVVLVGMGEAGRRMVEDYFTQGVEKRSYPGLSEADIPGFIRLDTVRDLKIK